MAYQKRDWDNTSNDVTKEDFKRIETGITNNDLEITKQKNATIPGTLAKQIADVNENVTKKLAKADVVNTTTQVESDGKALNAAQANPNVAGTLAQQINDLLPKRIGISTLNGWQQAVTVNLSLNGNIVTVTGIINGGTATNGTAITTITDTRFKPSTLQKAFCDQYGGAYGNARKRLSVSSNGNITLDEAFDSASFYMLNFSYPVGA